MKKNFLPTNSLVVTISGFLSGATFLLIFITLKQHHITPQILVWGIGVVMLAGISLLTIFLLNLNGKLNTINEQLKVESIQYEQKSQQIWEVQERFRALMENTILGVAIIGTDFKILEVNKKFSQLFKKKQKEFVGNFCYKDFEKRDAVCPHCPGKRAIQTGETVEVFTQGVLDDGNFFYAWNRAFPIYDPQGVVKGFVEIVEDVTKQKVAENELRKAFDELRQLQAQLVQSEKMASIGQLAAGIAHEINNPTAFIASNLSSLTNYIEDIKSFLLNHAQLFEQFKENKTESADQKQKDVTYSPKKMSLEFIMEDMLEALKESREGTNRILSIVQALRTFSNIDGEEYVEMDLNEGIESTLIIIQNELREGLEIQKALSTLPKIRCYPQQINLLFLNLLLNAIHAIDNNGTITIQSYCDDENVYIQFSDTGKGIDSEHLGKIFDPFFTTEEIGKGRGLGLSTSYNIVKKHNGEISVESELGKGTCLTIQLPFQ